MNPIFHTILGYPTIQGSVEIAKAIDRFSPAYLELQIPFSDPLADGEIIMRCSNVALERGAKLSSCLAAAQEISSSVRAKCLFVCYFNTILNAGIRNFCDDAKNAGVTGLIVPDYTIENEAVEHLVEQCKKSGLAFIPVVTAETPIMRLEKLRPMASEFVYCTSRLGITSGEGAQLTPMLADYIMRVRELLRLPIAVGFGISHPAEIAALKEFADYAVVGSAIAKLISPNTSELQTSLNQIEEFLTKLLDAP